MTTKYPVAPLPIGSRIEGLVIERVLRQGPTHVSYLASDPQLARRFVLRECLPPGSSRGSDQCSISPGDSNRAGFWQEQIETFSNSARQAAALDHPSLGEVLRLIEANGTAYRLMPYYEGQALDQAMGSDGGQMPDDSSSLVRQLMEALEYLHQQGQTHGAISPEHILVASDRVPVLLPANEPVAADHPYAAPEQQNQRDPSGAATDLYQLAATLYRAFTGKPPARAAERIAATAAGDADPLIPAQTLLPVGSHGGLADAIDQGLALDPAKRPHSAAHWARSFASIDWRLRSSQPSESDIDQEPRDWLPLAVISGLVVIGMVVSVYLLRSGPVDELQWQPDESSTPVTGPADGVRVKEPDDEERRQWQAALQADTVLAYRRFLETYPNSFYREQAQVQLNILDEQLWEKLSDEDTQPAYEEYLRQFPSGLHEAAALRRIEQIDAARTAAERERLERERQDKLAWEEARGQRTLDSIRAYISDWPAGIHIEEAQKIERQLEDQRNDNQAFATARDLNTKDAYQSYLNAFPRGAHVTKALQAVDDLTLRPGKVFKDCERCPEMVVVPAGTFLQGAAADDPLATPMEQPQRRISIARPFAAGVFEVTMAEWDACVADGACAHRPTDNGWGRADRPVMMVSWNDAVQYTGWLNEQSGESYRLPSESEWEYMARAGTNGNWLFDDPAEVCQFGNIAGRETDFQWRHDDCADPVSLGTLPVGTLRPNDFGLFDVIGNVAEWTTDCMNLSYLDAPTDGRPWTRGLCSSHMARGGSWVTGTRDIRLPARFNLKNGDRNDFTGFRVVRSIDE